MKTPSFWLVAIALSIWSCGTDQVAGGGSETTNGIVYSASGSPVVGAKIIARPSSFRLDTNDIANPLSIDTSIFKYSTTDTKGAFKITGLVEGSYRIEIQNTDTTGLSVVTNINDIKKQPELGSLILGKLGNLSGKITSDVALDVNVYIQVEGTEKTVKVIDGSYEISGLPPGNYKLHKITSSNLISNDTIAVSITPAQTAVIPLIVHHEKITDWQNTASLLLQTAAINVTDTLFNFPLLVRMDGTKIPFTTLNPAYIRFSNGAGKLYPFEVDHWGASSAACWVLIDTLLPKQSTQSLMIHWNNTNALPAQTQGTVFADSNQYIGVWHLNEPANNLKQGYHDQSALGLNFTSTDTTPLTSLALIGNGVKLDSDAYLESSKRCIVTGSRPRTYSLWAKINKFNDGGLFQAGSTGPDTATDFSLRTTSPPWVPGIFRVDTRGKEKVHLLDTLLNNSVDNWRMYTVVHDGSVTTLYYDGLPAGNLTYPAPFPILNTKATAPFRVGYWTSPWVGPFYLAGEVDEVRAQSVARSPAWVKAEFENQKSGSVFPTWQ